MTTQQITVSALAAPIHSGDWHDKPLRWTVQGPAAEVQNFSTKKDAQKYASIRRRSTTYSEASRKWSNHFCAEIAKKYPRR